MANPKTRVTITGKNEDMTPQRNRTLIPFGGPDRRQHQQPPVEGMAKEQKWPGTTMVAGILILVSSFWTVGELTLITYGTLFRWFAFFAFAGNLVPYGASGLRLGMERLEWFLFNLLAAGPILLSTSLWINFSFHGPMQWYDLTVAERKIPVKRYWIDTGELPGRLRDTSTVPFTGTGAGNDHEPLGYALSTGCFGYPVVTHPFR